jgi:uncharacterized protein
MNPRQVNQEIADYLQTLEATERIKVLYAVESGSRAWGFPSPDSDYDVRFLYIRPIDWYLTIQKRRDVIEAMTEPDLDFAGWDLPKTLGLLQKSNPSLLEWIGSPIVYRQDDAFMAEFRPLAEQCLSLGACHYHYVSMAKANWLAYFKGDQVSLKKYLYVLRPLFACRWIERYQTMPPVEFGKLVTGAGEPGSVQFELNQLLSAKSETTEMGLGPRRTALDEFIEQELERLTNFVAPTQPPFSTEILDNFFRTSLHRFGPAN